VLRVRDNSVGIAPEGAIFDMFMQGQSSLDRAEGGIGVGLTLVRRLTELHGGRVDVSSPVGDKGSEFVIRLPTLSGRPRRDADQPAPLARPHRSTARRRIVVVDDNVDSAQSLALLLEYDGHEVCVAHAGDAAIDAARGFRPHVVLLDIGLPGMNGYDVARRLRVDPEVPALTLVALTGYGQDEDRERSRAAGFDHHLTKPVEYDRLAALLGSLQVDPVWDTPPMRSPSSP
jgi:two-component system CheB/CheR fusion protein